MKTAALLAAILAMFTACQSCKTTDGQPQPQVVTAAVTCGAPAAAELIQDATAALASLDSEWRPHLTDAATKYGAEALNCALQQLLAGWATSRAISAEEHKGVERASEWLSSNTRALAPALTCTQCWSFCGGHSGACFNCCCFHQC